VENPVPHCRRPDSAAGREEPKFQVVRGDGGTSRHYVHTYLPDHRPANRRKGVFYLSCLNNPDYHSWVVAARKLLTLRAIRGRMQQSLLILEELPSVVPFNMRHQSKLPPHLGKVWQGTHWSSHLHSYEQKASPGKRRVTLIHVGSITQCNLLFTYDEGSVKSTAFVKAGWAPPTPSFTCFDPYPVCSPPFPHPIVQS
jgi:hypothetical protein